MIEFIVAFVLLYTVHMLGVTVGYHRLLSHRSFKCSKVVEYFFVLAGYLAMEGSPITWAVIHRAHHKHPDTAADPHGPSAGLFYQYAGWMLKFRYTNETSPAALTPDLLKDPLYRFLDQDGHLYRGYFLCVVICVLLRISLFFLVDSRIALASVFAGIAAQQMPLILNLVSHIPKYGYRNFETSDNSVNVPWIAFLTLGEGWHNNHHAFPGSARSGFAAHEIDVSWLVLQALQRIGLVQTLNLPDKSLPSKLQAY
ncbi:MAG: acyl-CoA desaturase [Candidatus Obscuribacterales bacterium]